MGIRVKNKLPIAVRLSLGTSVLFSLVSFSGYGTPVHTKVDCEKDLKATTQKQIPVTGLPASMARLIRKVINPLIFDEKGVTDGIRLRINAADETFPNVLEWNRTGNTLRIFTPRGRYSFVIHPGTDVNQLGHRVAKLDVIDENTHIEGNTYLHPNWLTEDALESKEHLDKLQGLVRTTFRADEYLHPHISSPNQIHDRITRPSFVQRELLARMVENYDAHRHARGKKDIFRIAQVQPGGMGKTVTLGHYLFQTTVRDAADGQFLIVVTVQDNDILSSVAEKLQAELHLQANQVVRKYNPDAGEKTDRADGTHAPITEKTRLVVVTRSTLQARQNEFLSAFPGKRVAIVFDEAHHVGKEEGEYAKFLMAAEKVLTSKDQLVFQSATLWHQDADIIARLVRGNVLGVFLDELEREELITNEKSIPSLSVRQLVRATMMGYLAPFHTVNLSIPRGNMNVRNVLEEYFIDSQGIEVATQVEQLTSDVSGRLYEKRHPFVFDRGLVYTRRIDRVNKMRDGLNRNLDEMDAETMSDHKSAVHAYHSGRGSMPKGKDWLLNRGIFNTVEDKRTHKYLVVDGKFNEGVDAPCINRVVLTKRYNVEQGGQELIQNITRGTRPAAGKTHLEVFAYTSDVADIDSLLQLLTGRVIQEAPPDLPDDGDEDGEEEFPPRPPSKGRKAPEGRTLLVNEPNLRFDHTQAPAMELQSAPEKDEAGYEEGPIEIDRPEATSSPAWRSEAAILTLPEGREKEAAIQLLRDRFNPLAASLGSEGKILTTRLIEVLDKVLRKTATDPKFADQYLSGRPAAVVLDQYKKLLSLAKSYQDSEYLTVSTREGYDAELADLARQELPPLKSAIESAWEELVDRFLGRSSIQKSTKDQTVRVTIQYPGGNKEKFTGVNVRFLAESYQAFFKAQGWDYDIADVDYNECRRQNWLRSITFAVTGKGAYDMMRFEEGIHNIYSTQGNTATAAATTGQVYKRPTLVTIQRSADETVGAAESAARAVRQEETVRTYHMVSGELRHRRGIELSRRLPANSRDRMHPDLLKEILSLQLVQSRRLQLNISVEQFKVPAGETLAPEAENSDGLLPAPLLIQRLNDMLGRRRP